MIIILDTSAAIEVVLKRPRFSELAPLIGESKNVLAPDLYVAEVANMFWKYHSFYDMPVDECETAIERSLQLVDTLIPVKELYLEAFGLASQVDHPVYDCLYLITARRNNGLLLTLDKKLKKIALSLNIKTI